MWRSETLRLLPRAAIRGGIGCEQSFSLADSFIRQVEEIDNIPEVEVFKKRNSLPMRDL